MAQAVPAQQGQQTLPTGSIEGTVVKVGTADGISKARVTLTIAQGSGTAQAVTADSEGKFVIRNLPAGQYRLTSTRDAYVTGSYGQRGPNGSGTAITLSDKQQLKDIRIPMTPSGAIAGRVISRDGEPVGNANVQAQRYMYQDGHRSLVTVQTVTTNDLGEYRLFWMPPGQYIVSAQPVQPLSADAGGTFFVQTTRGGPAGVGAQLGVGGVQRITITGANAAGPLDFNGPGGPGGPGGPPPPPPPPPPPGVNAGNPDVAYLPVYYPGTIDAAAATAIDLRAGGTVTGVNMTVVEVHPVGIRGQVMSGGRPAAGAEVSIYQGSANSNGNISIRSATVTDMGTFEFRNVAPGSYELAATLNSAGTAVTMLGTSLGNASALFVGNRGGRNPNQPTMAAKTHVEVGTSDIDNVSLVLEAAFNINGKLTMEGRPTNASDSTMSAVRLQLQSDPLIPPLAVASVNPEASGAFAIPGVAPGNYRLTVAGLPRNSYVKSALFNGVDVMNGGLRIDADPRGSLDVVLGTTPGSLDVMALDDKQMPVSGVTVVLVPDAGQQKRYDIYKNATSDASGKNHWDGLVPGDYKVYAWEDVENYAWTDPEFMRSVEGRGTSVHIDNGGRAMVTAKVIPYGK